MPTTTQKIKQVKRMYGTSSQRMEEVYGIHPYEKLCHVCELPDCLPSYGMCLQRMVARKARMANTDSKFHNRLSWRTMTEMMVKAGLACFLGELIEVFGMEDLVKEYGQIELSELNLEHPEYVMAKEQPIIRDWGLNEDED